MKTTRLGRSNLQSSRIAYGCWRIAGTWNPAEVTAKSEAAGRQAVIAAYEAGYTLFDHADIYADGVAEQIFARVLKQVTGMRERVLIATKCGIRKPGEPTADAPVRYDFSAEYILKSCEGSLKRLGIEQIDLYQLHRPDYLMNPEEVAGAFSKLKEQGKVREFGVSNFKLSQVEMLQGYCPMPLIVNQVEISLAKLTCFEDGTLDQCVQEKITPLAWSPLAGGILGSGARRLLPWQEAYKPDPIVAELDALANKKGATRTAVALAWLLKHPSGIVPIVGSTNPQSIREAACADDLELTREEWYRLLEASRGERVP